MNDDCDHPDQSCIVTTAKMVHADHDDDIWVLTAMDFDDPDTVQVELFCAECGRLSLLSANEWEVA